MTTRRSLIEARIAARTEIVPLTTQDVLTGNVSDFHENYGHRSDGTCYSWRRNGALKTWKTRPDDFRQPIKYGLRDYSAVTESNVDGFHDASECPVDRVG